MAKGWEDRLTGERVWQAREKEESRKEGQYRSSVTGQGMRNEVG